MTTLNALIHDGLDAGQSVAEIAEAAGVTTSSIYQRMRRLGRSATAVAAERTDGARNAVQCRTLDGYRVCADGRIQSCWSRGCAPEKTPHWRDLKIQLAHKSSLYVQIGSTSGGSRRRLSLLRVYLDAFTDSRGEDRAHELLEKVRRKMGLQ